MDVRVFGVRYSTVTPHEEDGKPPIVSEVIDRRIVATDAEQALEIIRRDEASRGGKGMTVQFHGAAMPMLSAELVEVPQEGNPEAEEEPAGNGKPTIIAGGKKK